MDMLIGKGLCSKEQFLAGAVVQIPEAAFREQYLRYTNGNPRFESHVCKLLGFRGANIPQKHDFGRKMLERVFGLKCDHQEASHKTKQYTGVYNWDVPWVEFVAKYQPRLGLVREEAPKGCRITDEDDEPPF